VRFFDCPHCGLGRVSLAVVIWNWSNVAPRSGLADGDGTGLPADSAECAEGVMQTDNVIDPGSGGPVGQARGVRGDVVAACSVARDAGKETLHILGNSRELAGRDQIDRRAGTEQHRIAKRSHRSAWAVAVLIPTGLAASIERGAGSFSAWIIDGDAVGAEVACSFPIGRESHWRRGGAGVAEPVVVGEEEEFLLERAEGN